MDMHIDYFHASRQFRAVIEGVHGHWGAWEGQPMGYAKTADAAIEVAQRQYEKAEVITQGRHCRHNCPKYDPF